jgi:hypothetical protein
MPKVFLFPKIQINRIREKQKQKQKQKNRQVKFVTIAFIPRTRAEELPRPTPRKFLGRLP